MSTNTIKACETLGLTWPASEKAIKRAYFRLTHTSHPDVGGSAALFRQVREAYDYLSAAVQPAQPITVPEAEVIIVNGAHFRVEYQNGWYGEGLLANMYVQFADVATLTTVPTPPQGKLEKIHVMQGEEEIFATCTYPVSICDIAEPLARYMRSQRWRACIQLAASLIPFRSL